MIRFYFIGLLVIFIVIPQNAHSIFLQPVLDIINVTGNLTCNVDSTDVENDFQLCAVRVYTYVNNTDESQDITMWDGIWFTNTFRQLIKTRNCTGFTDTSDIGSGTCDPMPYETADTMTLCICATNGCNRNLKTCISSVDTSENVPVLPTIMSDLTVTIQCDNAADNYTTCLPAVNIASIDTLACESYIKTHSVLCAIITDTSGTKIQQALIEENYQSYLTNSLHELKLLPPQVLIDTIDQTSNIIYVKYSAGTITHEQCGCVQNNFCNYNISTCDPNTIQIATTIPMEFSSTLFTDLTSESITVTTSTAVQSTISVITTTDSATLISATTINSTTSIPLMTADSDTSISMKTTDSTTLILATPTNSATPISITASDSNTPISAMTGSSATPAITNNVTTPSVENLTPGATGLSNGAIAGIVVGAVLVVVVGIIALIFFKLVNSGKLHWSTNRANNYRL